MSLWRVAILMLVAWCTGFGFAEHRFAPAPRGSVAAGGSEEFFELGTSMPCSVDAELRALGVSYDLLASLNAEPGSNGDLGPAKLRIRSLSVVHLAAVDAPEPDSPGADPRLPAIVRANCRPRPPPAC